MRSSAGRSFFLSIIRRAAFAATNRQNDYVAEYFLIILPNHYLPFKIFAA